LRAEIPPAGREGPFLSFLGNCPSFSFLFSFQTLSSFPCPRGRNLPPISCHQKNFFAHPCAKRSLFFLFLLNIEGALRIIAFFFSPLLPGPQKPLPSLLYQSEAERFSGVEAMQFLFFFPFFAFYLANSFSHCQRKFALPRSIHQLSPLLFLVCCLTLFISCFR